MTLLHDNDQPDLEDGVRSMLHRLAAGVSEAQPAWDELVGQHDRRPVIAQAGCRAAGRGGGRRPRRARHRGAG